LRGKFVEKMQEQQKQYQFQLNQLKYDNNLKQQLTTTTIAQLQNQLQNVVEQSVDRIQELEAQLEEYRSKDPNYVAEDEQEDMSDE